MGYSCDYLLSYLIQINRRLGALLILKFYPHIFPPRSKTSWSLAIYLFTIFMYIPYLSLHKPSYTFPLYTPHNQNSHSLIVYACLQFFLQKPPLHSFLFSFLTLLFFSMFCFYIRPLHFGFFQSYSLFCHVPLHSFILNILFCPPFLHSSPYYYHPFSSSHFAFPLLWCFCYMYSLNVIFSHYFFLINFVPFFLCSEQLNSSHPHSTSLKKCTFWLIFLAGSRTRGKGQTMTDHLLVNISAIAFRFDFGCRFVDSSKIISYNPDSEFNLPGLLTCFISRFHFSLKNNYSQLITIESIQEHTSQVRKYFIHFKWLKLKSQ